MDMLLVAQGFFALILVLFLIILSIGICNKFLSKHRYFAKFSRKKNLGIKEIIIIDQHNKVIEIARKNKRHLILIGKNTEKLLETYDEIDLSK